MFPKLLFMLECIPDCRNPREAAATNTQYYPKVKITRQGQIACYVLESSERRHVHNHDFSRQMATRNTPRPVISVDDTRK